MTQFPEEKKRKKKYSTGKDTLKQDGQMKWVCNKQNRSLLRSWQK